MTLRRHHHERRRVGSFFCSLLLCAVTAGCLRTMEALDPRTLPAGGTVAQQLHQHVAFLASPQLAGRRPGTDGNRRAADYLEQQFRAAGLQPFPSLHGYRQPIAPDIGDNLLGFLPPAESTEPPRWILLGAHFDHLGGEFVGADDNASSVAILLETLRATHSLRRYGLVFIAFNSEESPHFGRPTMGSQFFAQHLPAEIGALDRLQSVIVMDLMGGVQWPPLKETIFAAGAEKSPGLYHRLKESLAPPLTVLPVGMHLIEEIPDHGHEAFSDYDVFRNHQVPFLFLSAGRTPRYHTPQDTADTLHYERMAATVAWLRRLIDLLDRDREPYRFEADRVEFADEAAAFRGIVEEALRDGRLIPGTSRWSRSALRDDAEWLRDLDVTAPTPERLERLERISIRVQCLLADYSGCFTL